MTARMQKMDKEISKCKKKIVQEKFAEKTMFLQEDFCFSCFTVDLL